MNRAAHNQASLTSRMRGDLWGRAACIAYLGMVALCSVLAFMSLLRGELELLIGALAAIGLAMGLRSLLRNHPTWSESDEADLEDEFSVANDAAAGSRSKVAGLVALLEEWDKLERARGSTRFDPWALQTVRNELREVMQEEPDLRCLLEPRSRG